MTSKGLACIGQDEVILLVEVLPDETRIPKDLLTYINQLYLEAVKGNISYIYTYVQGISATDGKKLKKWF